MYDKGYDTYANYSREVTTKGNYWKRGSKIYFNEGRQQIYVSIASNKRLQVLKLNMKQRLKEVQLFTCKMAEAEQ